MFVSYSHKDQGSLDLLSDHLASLENDDLVDLWDDREIRAGGSLGWEEQLLPKLNSAGVIILLLSPAFAGSHYCQRVELPRALERKEAGEALVFLIHLRKYDIEERLRVFQILPSVTKSINGSPDPDAALCEVTQKIRAELKTFSPTRRIQRRSSKAVPAYLPYLCNRTDQEDELQILRERYEDFCRRPIVYMVGGLDCECHEAFHERIAKDLLPGLVGIPGAASADPIPLEWPARAGPGREAWTTFAARLARKLDSASSKPDEVLRCLPEGLTYLVTSLEGDGWSRRQRDLLRTFIEYWSAWPDLTGNRAICMGISIVGKHAGPTGAMLRAAFPEAAYPGVRFRVLPDLQPPGAGHAVDWLSHRKVKACYDWETRRDELRPRVGAIFADRTAIPMRQLAAPLMQVLESAL
jgi:hypothetical protein